MDLLFSPIKIKSLEIPNRVVMSAMNQRFAADDDSIQAPQVRYYRDRAEAGVGLIMVGVCTVCPDAGSSPKTLGAYEPAHFAALAEVVEAVHGAGAKVACQIGHAGLQAWCSPIGPSLVTYSGMPDAPHVLTTGEVSEMIGRFIWAACQAYKVGFDAVELHGATGYLLNSFISPATNHRQDQYGGSLENRLRMLAEIIRGIRREVGAEAVLMCRFSAHDFRDDGLTPMETKEIARCLVEEGIDILNVTGGMARLSNQPVPPDPGPYSFLASLAGKIKEAVSAPVVAVGKIKTPQVAEAILASGTADMVALGHALLADASWALKASNGQSQEIHQCAAPTCTRGSNCMDLERATDTCLYYLDGTPN